MRTHELRGPDQLSLRAGRLVFLFYPDTETVTMTTPFRAVHMTFNELEDGLTKRLDPPNQRGSLQRGAFLEREARKT